MKYTTKRQGANLNVFDGDNRVGSIYYCYTKKTVVFEQMNDDDYDCSFQEKDLLEITELIKEERKNYWGGLLKE